MHITHPEQRNALIEVLNYLADEEQHYERCEESEQENHIWKQREILRNMIESKDTQTISSTTVIIMEGGIVQHAYCPNPDIEFDYLVVDYDCEEGGIEGYKELIEALEIVHEEEQKYDYEPSINRILEEKKDELYALQQVEEKRKKALNRFNKLSEYVAGRVDELFHLDTDTLEHVFSVLKDELDERRNT